MADLTVGDLVHVLTKLGISAVSNEAQDILRDEPPKLTALYVYWCRHRDYSTAVVGVPRRISYQSMIEWMDTPVTTGRSGEKYTKPMIQSCIRRLVALGLAVDHGNCVFYLPKELLDQSVLRRLLRGCYEVGSTQVTDIKANNGGSLLLGKSEVATPLFNQSINQSVVDKFVMSDGWGPADSFSEQARLAGFDVSKDGKDRALMNLALGDVRMYWQANKPEEQRNQHGWHLSLLGTMKALGKQGEVKPAAGSWSGKKSYGGAGKRSRDGLPVDDNGLSAWARANGARQARPGESYFDYRQVLRAHLSKRVG